MKNYVQDAILSSTGASKLEEIETIQNLWSGYGTIKRYKLIGSDIKRVVVKHVDVAAERSHPRGWESDRSHQRKLKSYNVELAWYRNWSNRLDDRCYVPKSYGLESSESNNYFLMILEDLDDAGFKERKTSVSVLEVKSCLKWLARFHATFLGESPDELWETGTYWHLDTRPDEFDALNDKALKSAASAIDQKLKNCPFQTFVHGDAKLANFCFSTDGSSVAAVDFQYVGGGCGMKDVAYLVGSCFDETDCEKYEEELLDFYFDVLGGIVKSKNKEINLKDLIESWRTLYPVAWVDFNRFIKGWSPGHWKINRYSELLTQSVLDSIY